MTHNALKTFRFVRLALIASVGFPLILASNAFAQLPAPAVPAEPGMGQAQQPGAGPAVPGTAASEVERVVVTGSNIPTAEETGPNPVDTYRPQDIEKLGIRSATDLQEFIPQQAGGTVNLNIGNAGDGTVQFNLRGILPKETLVLIDGKRVAYGSLATAGASGGPDINLIPFSMVDHVDILKDGASAVYGSDAIAGVVNFFLIHKFRGLEIGGTYGNTNMGASNDMGEWEAWIKAGTGDDKTDIVVVADFWQRTGGVYSRDRDISSNGDFNAFGGFDARSGNFPGRLGSSRLIPSIFFSAFTPTPHSAPNRANSPFYISPAAFGIRDHVNNLGNPVPGDGNYSAYNFASVTSALSPADRQVYYGSFVRDICDKYLTVFGDFKYARSYYSADLAAVPFTPDPFHVAGTDFPTVGPSGPNGISVPISNAFNPFTVGDVTLNINGQPVPLTTGVRFRGVVDTGIRSEKFTYWDQLFDVGLRGQMGEFADYLKTWNWEAGFRYSRNEGQDLSVGEVSQAGLRDALFDTNPATAFNPFGGFNRENSGAARSRVYVTLHNSGEYELPIYYATFNGDLFNLPGGPVSFAIGGEYDAPRFTRDRDSLNTTFNSIGSTDGQSYRVNRDIWAVYEEVRVPFTSPTWNFPGFYSFEVDFAEREEWYSQNTSSVLPSGLFPAQPAVHSRYNAQKPKVSVRWQPMDPKYIGALTLRGSYTEAFHAPQLSEITPASSQGFPVVADPFSLQTEPQIEDRVLGNPNTHPEVAYEWTYGAVYSPKWIKGLTLSADWWHIDMRDIITALGAQTIILENPPPNNGASTVVSSIGATVVRGAGTNPNEPGPVQFTIDPSANLSGAIFEGLDYEAIYILDSTVFGGSDWGRLTTTVNGTWLSRAEFQAENDKKRFGIAGQFLPPGFALTSSLPWNRANFSIFYDGPADTWMQGLDLGVVLHWTGEYNDDNASLTASQSNPIKLQTPRTQGPFLTLDGSPNPNFGQQSTRARNVSAWTTV